MEITGDPEALAREVLQLARRESAKIISAAEDEAEELLAQAGEAARAAGRARLEAAQAEAGRRGAMLLASVSAEAARYRGARLEAALDRVKAEAARRLAACSGAPAAEALTALAAQAAGAMEGSSFIFTLAPADAAVVRGRAGEIERLAGKGRLELAFEEDPAVAGGVLARDPAGRQFWDNSFKARLGRFWPELRGAVAGNLAGEGK
ncbi:MAG: V-type ATP synthase subunit E [Elusimicrobia bacterium]|nr:V-type ATP synthase subunit E [Elusimicrobiota bacterium]